MKPVILLLGNNEVTKKEYLNSILQDFPKDYIFTYYADEADTFDIFSQCYQNSLFNVEKIIIVKNIDKISEKNDEKSSNFWEKFDSYLNNYNPDNTLIIIAEKLKDSFISKINKIGEVKEFKKYYKNDLVSYIYSKLKENNIIFDKEIPELLLYLTNEDIELIDMNLNILIQYSFSAKRLTLSDVQELLSRTNNMNIFDFINGIFTKDKYKALHSLNDLKLTIESISILTHMINRTANFLWIYIASIDKENVVKELNIKSFEARKLSDYAKKVDLKYISRIFELLNKVEILSKTANEELAYLEIENFLLSL